MNHENQHDHNDGARDLVVQNEVPQQPLVAHAASSGSTSPSGVVSADLASDDGAQSAAKNMEAALKIVREVSRQTTERGLSEEFVNQAIAPFYYCFPNYYAQLSAGSFIQIDRSSLQQRICDTLSVHVTDPKHALAVANKLILRIQNTRFVDSVTEAAGFPRGAYTSPAGRSVLVIHEAKHLVPIANDWTHLRGFLDQVLGDEQLEYFLGTLSVFARHLHRLRDQPELLWTRQPIPAIVMTGPPACGKTLLLSLLVEMFGGRSANPFRYFSGRSSFNGELIAAEVLAVDDETGSPDNATRARMASGLKQWLFANEVKVEAKYKNAVMMPVHSILVYSLNENPSALMCLPALENSISDKISLFKLGPPKGGFPIDPGEKATFITQLKADIPALLHYLLHEHEIRPELLNARTGIKTFHNPEVVAALSDLSAETEALEMILMAFRNKKEILLPDDENTAVKVWSGKGHALHAILEGDSTIPRHRLRQLMSSKSDMGIRLYELSQSHPTIVRRGNKSKGSRNYELWLSVRDYREILPELSDADSIEEAAA